MTVTKLHEAIMHYFKQKDVDALKQVLDSACDIDVSDATQDLSAENMVVIYRLLSKDKALFVFEQLDTAFQQQLLRSFADEAAIELIESMTPDDTIWIITYESEHDRKMEFLTSPISVNRQNRHINCLL